MAALMERKRSTKQSADWSAQRFWSVAAVTVVYPAKILTILCPNGGELDAGNRAWDSTNLFTKDYCCLWIRGRG
jgi:hypothetical protein